MAEYHSSQQKKKKTDQNYSYSLNYKQKINILYNSL